MMKLIFIINIWVIEWCHRVSIAYKRKDNNFLQCKKNFVGKINRGVVQRYTTVTNISNHRRFSKSRDYCFSLQNHVLVPLFKLVANYCLNDFSFLYLTKPNGFEGLIYGTLNTLVLCWELWVFWTQPNS